jgi:ABC-type phosphate transport system auxiliary subunit
MIGPGQVFLALIVIGLPIMALTAVLTRWMRLKERKFEVEASLAVEKAAQYAASNAELEARVRVLEKIVTDSGAQTAAQIEALREQPARLEAKEKIL